MLSSQNTNKAVATRLLGLVIISDRAQLDQTDAQKDANVNIYILMIYVWKVLALLTGIAWLL